MSRRKLAKISLYNLKYPQYLPWKKAQWVIEKGDIVLDSMGAEYEVHSVYKTPIEGKLPKISLKKLSEDLVINTEEDIPF